MRIEVIVIEVEFGIRKSGGFAQWPVLILRLDHATFISWSSSTPVFCTTVTAFFRHNLNFIKNHSRSDRFLSLFNIYIITTNKDLGIKLYIMPIMPHGILKTKENECQNV